MIVGHRQYSLLTPVKIPSLTSIQVSHLHPRRLSLININMGFIGKMTKDLSQDPNPILSLVKSLFSNGILISKDHLILLFKRPESSKPPTLN